MRFSLSTPLCVVCRDVCFLVDSSDSMRFWCWCDWFDLAGLSPFQWTSIKLLSDHLECRDRVRSAGRACIHFSEVSECSKMPRCSASMRILRLAGLGESFCTTPSSAVVCVHEANDFIKCCFSMHLLADLLENSFHREDIQKLNFLCLRLDGQKRRKDDADSHIVSF